MAKSYSDKLRDPQWQKKRLDILSRDNYTCKLCGDGRMELHVHHLSYAKSGNPWDVPNEKLITYCKCCHLLIEKYLDVKEIEKIIKIQRAENTYLVSAVIPSGAYAKIIHLFLFDSKENTLIKQTVLSNYFLSQLLAYTCSDIYWLCQLCCTVNSSNVTTCFLCGWDKTEADESTLKTEEEADGK